VFWSSLALQRSSPDCSQFRDSQSCLFTFFFLALVLRFQMVRARFWAALIAHTHLELSTTRTPVLACAILECACETRTSQASQASRPANAHNSPQQHCWPNNNNTTNSLGAAALERSRQPAGWLVSSVTRLERQSRRASPLFVINATLWRPLGLPGSINRRHCRHRQAS
jgi:hypothetical protein